MAPGLLAWTVPPLRDTRRNEMRHSRPGRLWPSIGHAVRGPLLTFSIALAGRATDAKASDFDAALLGCTVEVIGPDEIVFWMSFEYQLPPGTGDLTVPHEILLNGESRGRQEKELVDEEGPDCPPRDGDDCPEPDDPCGTTDVIYKRGTAKESVTTFDWTCEPTDDGDTCTCKKPLIFTFPQAKHFEMPGEPTLFEVVIDPDGVIEELDETNNTCDVFFEPGVLGVPDDPPDGQRIRWARLKDVYR